MRRPRIGFAGQFPGGPGQPSGPTTGVCLQWLDGAGCAGAKAPPIWKALLKRALPSRNGSTAPGTEIAAGGAPGGAFPDRKGKGTPRKRSGRFAPAQEASQASAFPGALLPILVETRWKTGPARAFTNNRAGGALLAAPKPEGRRRG